LLDSSARPADEEGLDDEGADHEDFMAASAFSLDTAQLFDPTAAARSLLEAQVQRLAAKLGELEPEWREGEGECARIGAEMEQRTLKPIPTPLAVEMVLQQMDLNEELDKLDLDLEQLDGELDLDSIDPGDLSDA